MYTRGQFAVMCNMGRKALRLYHEEGLLVPVYINEDNGYHYYDEKQLETAERIKRYRKLGLSLFEIKQILDGRANETDVIESKIHETDKLLGEMKEYNASAKTEQKEKSDVIDHRPFVSCKCIFIDENTEREDLGMSVGKLYEKASREGMQIAGAHFVIYEVSDNGESLSMKTCLPVTNFSDADILEISEENTIHMNFKGGFSKVWKAHRMLHDHAESEGIVLSQRIYEVYNKYMSVDGYYTLK